MAGEALVLLRAWVLRQSSTDADRWFRDALAGASDERSLALSIGLAPRRLGRANLRLDEDDLRDAARARPCFDPSALRVDQAARIALLLASGEAAGFAERLTRLARTVDVDEMVSFLRGLPLYPEPERLIPFAAEGVRSGIPPVFEAVAHRNPFPAERFTQEAWNQMVLKALFMERSLAPIQGLDARANPALATALVDYAHERWAAGRAVSPELWRCVGPHADARGLAALEQALGGDAQERAAAIAALRACPSPDIEVILAKSGTASIVQSGAFGVYANSSGKPDAST